MKPEENGPSGRSLVSALYSDDRLVNHNLAEFEAYLRLGMQGKSL